MTVFNLDIIRENAQDVLQVSAATGTIDNFFWDRTLRLIRNIEKISRLPEIIEANFAIDRKCLMAATYFSESGLARYVASEHITAYSFTELNPADLQELSTQIVRAQLDSWIDDSRINKICDIIIASYDRFSTQPEAMILSDARNLDDMGAIGLFNDFRKTAANGKGVSDALQAWKRKIDYRYWQARLKECFRFKAVREIAERRFTVAEKMMTQLHMENHGKDLEELLLEAVDNSLED